MATNYNSINRVTNKEVNISQLENKLSFRVKNHNNVNGKHVIFSDYRFFINKYGIFPKIEEKPNTLELSKILQRKITDLRNKKCFECSNIANEIVKEYSMYLSGRIF